MRLQLSVLALALVCACSDPLPVPSAPCSPECDADHVCVAGVCKLKAGAARDAATEEGSDAEVFLDDAGQIDRPDATATIKDPNNPNKDSDCDGLSDAEEFANVYGTAHLKTDPGNSDSDGDGLTDGIEAGRTTSPDPRCTALRPDLDPATRTDPTNPDSDGDGMKDGDEDKNHDGRRDPSETSPTHADTDGDGLADGVEDKNRNGQTDPGETDPLSPDSDRDGLADGDEDKNRDGKKDVTETDPTNPDTDGDGCIDGSEVKSDKNPLLPTDCNGTGVDSDGDGISDQVETTVTHTDPFNADTDGDGIKDGVEDKNQDGKVQPNESDPLSRDSDCDGIGDYLELQVYKTSPLNPDTDGDGLLDGLEIGTTVNPEPTYCLDFVPDTEPASRTNPSRIDSDCDGVPDGSEDTNHNGRIDPTESDPARRDSDGDGLSDGVEMGFCKNLDPANCAGYVADADCGATKTDPAKTDTDGDGLPDGTEDANKNGKVDPGELNPLSKDSDCDGLSDNEERALRCDPAKADTDGDGVKDGVELGRTASPDPTCTFAGDADPASTTLPYVADSDGDGLKDGQEDKNKDGRVDINESDPKKVDSDSDGLSDGTELKYGSDPLNPDSDGDGLKDGQEDFNHDGVRQTTETDALKADTDGDSCSDGAEDKNGNHVVDSGETSPLRNTDCGPARTNKDSDCDGLTDEVETNAVHTSPTNPDTDGDGILDGREVGVTVNPDPNSCPEPNFVTSVYDNDSATVTNPLRVDTDCDGIRDGAEDANRNGKREATETAPNDPDTDKDGLTDGVEAGVCTNADATNCPAFKADGDCAASTNPVDPDSDDDGVWDGTEDSNQNGKVDPGELNPNVSDANGPDLQACAQANLKPIQLIERSGRTADVSFAVVPEFLAADQTTIRQASQDRGVMVYDRTTHVAGFAFKLPAALNGADVGAQLATLEARMGSAGTLSGKFVQVFTTWDGFPAAGAQYTWTDSGNNTVGAAANDLVTAMFGSGNVPTNLLGGTALGTEIGPFRLKLQLVKRSTTSNVVVGALTREASLTEARGFRLDDLTNGSALAQFGDTTAVQCDRMTVKPRQPVDFIWVVDNSGSMDGEQTAVRLAATAMSNQLSGTTADWRLMVITSDADYIGSTVTNWNNASYGTASAPKYCPFTTSAATFQDCISDLGTDGSGYERFFRPIACLFGAGSATTPYGLNCGRTSNGSYTYSYQTPPVPYPLVPRATPATVNKLRPGALAAFIFVTDTNEQSDGMYEASASSPVPTGSLTNIPAWVNYFKNYDGNGPAFVAGLVCPAGGSCSDSSGPYMNTRWPTFFSQMGGVYSDLPDDDDPNQQAKIAAAIALILDKAVGQASPYVLAKPPISATIKVATEATLENESLCNKNDMPRSRTNGFDYDGATRALKFYGACRPKVGQENKRISVSYRYWNDRTNDPDGGNPPCGGPCASPKVCDPISNTCVCPGNCGGTCSSPLLCDMTTCGCVCPPDCGGTCTGNLTCNTSPSVCKCQCQQNQSCGAGFVWDGASCACVCNTAGLGCLPTQNADPLTCSCLCKSDCGGCTSPKVCDPAACACACDPTKTCPAGQRLDANTCACVCDPDALFCGPNEYANTSTCTCSCRSDCGGCVAGFLCDPGTCSCQCDTSRQCNPVEKLDPASCSCVCDTAKLNCLAPLVADPASCSCICAADCGGCQAGYACNPASCACECPTNVSCPAGTVFDRAKCGCVCDTAALNCAAVGPNYQADPATCACVCKPNCGGCSGEASCDLSTCTCTMGPT